MGNWLEGCWIRCDSVRLSVMSFRVSVISWRLVRNPALYFLFSVSVLFPLFQLWSIFNLVLLWNLAGQSIVTAGWSNSVGIMLGLERMVCKVESLDENLKIGIGIVLEMFYGCKCMVVIIWYRIKLELCWIGILNEDECISWFTCLGTEFNILVEWICRLHFCDFLYQIEMAM